MRVAVWRDGEGLSQRASQLAPRVTASDGSALNLLQLLSTKSRHLSTCLSIRVWRGGRCIILALRP